MGWKVCTFCLAQGVCTVNNQVEKRGGNFYHYFINLFVGIVKDRVFVSWRLRL